jgi:hypothetical protein
MFDIQTKRLIIINGIELNLFGKFDYTVEIYTKMQYITAEKPFRLWRIISVSFASLLLDTHVSE